jgi:putative transposase
MAGIVTHLRQLKKSCWDTLTSRLTRWTKPLVPSLPLAALTDLGRSKSELIAENALLRVPLIILKRQVKRPVWTQTDRVLLVFVARLVRTWNQALLLVQPETRLARAAGALAPLVEAQVPGLFSPAPKVAAETIALIQEMAKDNRLWGAERIRGELLKLGLRVCKRTIQKDMRGVRTHQP